MRKMLLVFNPKAGRGEFARKLYNVIDLFSRANYQIEVYPTNASGSAKTYIQTYGANFDLIVCSGGDGTMNEVLNAYMKLTNSTSEFTPPGVFTPPQLAYIPSGTVNDFASTLKLPRNVMQSVKSILNGRPRMIDIGLFGNRYFSYVAAFGFFTDIPYLTDQKAKNVLGRAAYFLESFKHLGNIPAIDCVIKIDGEIIEGQFMLGIIANSTSIGGFKFNFNKNAAIDDGFFEAIFLQAPKNFIELQDIIKTLQDIKTNSNFFIKRSAKEIEFSSSQLCDWTIDGEFGGKFYNVNIKNIHNAINIVVPPISIN